MTFYYQRTGTKEQENKLNLSKNIMDEYYNKYQSTYKILSVMERNTLWNKYLKAKEQVKNDFKPFGFIC